MASLYADLLLVAVTLAAASGASVLALCVLRSVRRLLLNADCVPYGVGPTAVARVTFPSLPHVVERL